MKDDWDVIVVGARVAGTATAMLLARAGLRVLCIDRSQYGSDTISTHALMRGGVLQLHRWGLLAGVAAAGTPPVRCTVFWYDGDPVRVTTKPSAGVHALYAPRRTVIDALLVDGAERAGAVIEFGTAITRLHWVDGVVAGVVVRDRWRAGEHTISAPLVIGADGRNSLVAREVNAVPAARGAHAAAYLYGYWTGLPTDGYEWFYRPGVAAGAIPTNAGRTCVFVGGHANRLDPLVRAGSAHTAFGRLAADAGVGPRLAAAEPAERIRYVRGLPGGYLRPAYGPGWALVGDAGHWADPLSTHGMTAALRDAGLLADALTAGSGRPAALATFQRTRDRLSRPILQISDEMAGFAWDLSRLRVLLRQLSSAMTDEVETLTSGA
jgi:2-polyprenyl-6-methoxyphenol hydroxylase-like FAD-dependent oxidoreductase